MRKKKRGKSLRKIKTALIKLGLPPIIILPADSREFRCPFCGKLLFKGVMKPGSLVETKCTRRQCRMVIKFKSIGRERDAIELPDSDRRTKKELNNGEHEPVWGHIP